MSVLSRRKEAAKGARGAVHAQLALTWLFGIEMVFHGGSAIEQAVSRTKVHLVDVGCGLGLVVPQAK